MNTANYPYATFLDIKFPPLQLIDVPAVVGAVRDSWFNQTLCKVNDSVLRLGVMQGEYHWHKHDHDDELFFVLEGRFFISYNGAIDEYLAGSSASLADNPTYQAALAELPAEESDVLYLLVWAELDQPEIATALKAISDRKVMGKILLRP